VRGARSSAINISSGITGDFTNTSTINGQGDGTRGINIEADIQGGFVNSGGVGWFSHNNKCKYFRRYSSR